MRKQPPDGPRFSNCPIWAIYRYSKRGGYLHIRQSKNVRWLPHFMWSRKMDSPWWGYVPNKPRRGIVATIHSLGFRGRIKQERRKK